MRESLYQQALLIVPVLFYLTFHELCHGYTSYRMGDLTANAAGRLTMNPFRHIYPIGASTLAIISRLDVPHLYASSLLPFMKMSEYAVIFSKEDYQGGLYDGKVS